MDQMLEQRMSDLGYRLKMVSIKHLKDMKLQIEENHNSGLIDENLYQWLIGYYQFDLPISEVLFSSIIIVASKSPLVQTIFQWRGGGNSFVIPPTYLDFLSEPICIKTHLEDATQGLNYHFMEAKHLPNKLIAVRSGLGKYGKNNLCYVPGMGSYVLLTTYYSDIPASENQWEPIRQMTICSNCNACVKNCPSAALSKNRFAIHAENCLTYHNEFWGKAEFPEWIPPNAHNCLIGCLKCQMACPENNTFLSMYEDIKVFNEEETEAVLGKKALNELPAELVLKLENSNLLIHYNYLSRNLQALLNKELCM